VQIRGETRLQTVGFEGFAARNSNPAWAGCEFREKTVDAQNSGRSLFEKMGFSVRH
jgi:hypothetical protein